MTIRLFYLPIWLIPVALQYSWQSKLYLTVYDDLIANLQNKIGWSRVDGAGSALVEHDAIWCNVDNGVGGVFVFCYCCAN